jgi:uncharacterized protein (TIGR03000 family)
MYSVVMAAIVTAGAGTTGFGHHWHGCHGYAYARHACYGYYSVQPHGCYGYYGGWTVAVPANNCCGFPLDPKTAGLPAGPPQYPPPKDSNDALKALGDKIDKMQGTLNKMEKVFNDPKIQKAIEKTIASGGAIPSDPSRSAATITVQLPSDAQVYMDDYDCGLTSDGQTFDTPALQPNKSYYYVVRAKLQHNGQELRQRVNVVAGANVTVDFNVEPGQIAQR